MRNHRLLILAVACMALLATSAFAYQVCVSPPYTLVLPDSSKQFTAVLKNNMGMPIPGVTFTWSVTPTGLGTITNTGLFTAGADTGSCTVHAVTTYQGQQYQGQAYVHIVASLPPPPPQYHVSIMPGMAWVPEDSSKQFSATLRNNMGQIVPGVTFTWSVDPTTLGTITQTGLFTAASDTGHGSIHAVTTYQGTQYSGTAWVTVVLPPPPPPPPQLIVSISPYWAWVPVDSSKQFTATLHSMMGPPIQGLTWTWTVTPATLGTISATGLFTAGDDTGSGYVHAATIYQGQNYTGQAYVRVVPPPPPPPGGGISGVITGGDPAVPLANARVSVYQQNSWMMPRVVYTNSTGNYTVANLVAGTYILKAEKMGYMPLYYQNATTPQNATPIPVTNTIVTGINVNLQVAAQIKGTVDSSNTTTPLPMTMVVATKIGSWGSFGAMTDSLGHYTIAGLTPGMYKVRASRWGYQTQYWDHKTSYTLADTVVVAASQVVTGIDFNLTHFTLIDQSGQEELTMNLSTPSEFYLKGASPNPFNPTTTISFSLPEASQVNLKVYDLQGRLVTTLVDGWRQAGLQQVTFDGSNLATGVYLYTLTAGHQTATGKMVLMK